MVTYFQCFANKRSACMRIAKSLIAKLTVASPQIEANLKIGRPGLKRGLRLSRLSSASFLVRVFSKLDLKFNNSLMLDASEGVIEIAR